MKPTLKLILLIIALVLLLCAAAGIGEWSIGTVHVQSGWAGLFFFAASVLAG